MQAALPSTLTPVVTSRISHLTIMVPYRKPGNVIEHLPVDFSVHQYGAKFKAFPLCDDVVIRFTNLPAVIEFEWQEDVPVLPKYDFTEGIKEIARKLGFE